MTIRDIAKLANVSVTTVSKIINNKDESISEETRSRVLRIVQEQRYSPYCDRVVSKARLLGVMLPSSYSQNFLSAIVERAKANGYGVVVCTSSNRLEELDNAKMMRMHAVSGVVWFQSSCSAVNSKEIFDAFAAQEIFVVTVGASSRNCDICIPWADLGKYASRIFREMGHLKIGSVVGTDLVDTEALLQGMNENMHESGYTRTEKDVFHFFEKESTFVGWLQEYTAVLCTDEQATVSVLHAAKQNGLRIPKDLSLLIALHGDAGSSSDLSSVRLPYSAVGTAAVDCLLARMQGRSYVTGSLEWEYKLNHSGSITHPISEKRKKIVIVGTINADTLIAVKKYPELGETVAAKGSFTMPGGKGLNQAVAAARLDMDVCLIARIGNDYEGRSISAFLKNCHVLMNGIASIDGVPTGKAYILTQNDAESSISVLKGANACLKPDDISEQKMLFQGASFCLLQTETNVDVVARALDIAKSNGVKTIVKPCALEYLDPELLKKIDILIPNQKEAAKLLPDIHSVEKQAVKFHEQGAGQIIITLGAKGCYWYDGTEGHYFPAAEFEAIDSTGAADNFIAALAAALSEGHDMTFSIRYATIAAGISTTRFGVSAAAVDRNTLELYCAREGQRQ